MESPELIRCPICLVDTRAARYYRYMMERGEDPDLFFYTFRIDPEVAKTHPVQRQYLETSSTGVVTTCCRRYIESLPESQEIATREAYLCNICDTHLRDRKLISYISRVLGRDPVPIGRLLGYADCCIDQMIDNPEEIFEIERYGLQRTYDEFYRPAEQVEDFGVDFVYMLPIRCYTCGKCLFGLEIFQYLTARGIDPGYFYQHFGIKNYCCRIHYLCPQIHLGPSELVVMRVEEQQRLRNEQAIIEDLARLNINVPRLGGGGGTTTTVVAPLNAVASSSSSTRTVIRPPSGARVYSTSIESESTFR